jgi:hypothetical protein
MRKPCPDSVIVTSSQDIDYDKVDWDESLDADDDREAEEKWFDDEEEDG